LLLLPFLGKEVREDGVNKRRAVSKNETALLVF
jgi:hypothetical protein